MRPSSSRSEGLFDGVFGRGQAAAEVRDEAWLQALLDVESALVTACAASNLVPQAAAEAIAAAAADPAGFDLSQLGAAAASAGNPVLPLVRALKERVGPAGARYVHFGATSQDILDSAMMLIARRAVMHIVAELQAAADAAAELATTHRDTPMVGRTLLQQALPTTFGLKAAGWALALDHAAEQVEISAQALPVQLGGAVGTLAEYGEQAMEVVAVLASALGLREPLLPWHTARAPVADLAGALGAACGGIGKVALDVCLLAQNEVAEVSEGTEGRGGSSAMPHKHNPIAAISARACALRAPGLVATLLTAMAQEHERAAGPWHAEWETLSDLLRSSGSAASWLRDSLAGLEVDVERMARNLDAAVELANLDAPSTGQAGPLIDRALAGRKR
jgi:3-carboxy-cis,cis-muconate cycloisomerase